LIEPGRSFERAAAEYDRGRPGWPKEMLDVFPVEGDAAVLDLAAGTGKLTETLVGRYRHVVAIEPLAAMRAFIARRAPAAAVLAGRAEEIPLPDAAVDAVFAGQAFHWFDHEAAVGEIARVLHPGGTLAAVWNEASDRAPSPLPHEYRRRLDSLHDELPPRAPPWREAVAHGPFEPLREAVVEHEQVTNRDGVLAFAASVSWIAHRPDEERRRVLAELGALLPPGEYRFPLVTQITWTRRR
jgi:SAM-dependent methyltransferase